MIDGVRIALVVARARNGVIGANGALPWRLPSDLKRFKATTMGKPIIMGRKTWDSLGRPLPGRANIVISRDAAVRPRGAWLFSTLEAGLRAGAAMAHTRGGDEVCVIGGAALYAATLPIADRLYLTEVDLAPEGDTWFPPFDEAAFAQTASETVARGEGDDAGFTLRVLDRRG